MALSGHIFISYARADGTGNAARLDVALPRQGFRTWRDQRGIDPTQDFTAEIERAIEGASYVVTCITPDVRRDDSFVRREIQYAQVMKKPIVVARFEDVAPPISVVSNTWIDFFKEGWDTAFERLCEMLRQIPGHYVAPQPTTPDVFKPYLNALYQQVVRYLDKTVFSSLPGQDAVSLIPLRSEAAHDAVQGSFEQAVEALTIAFFDMAGVNSDAPALFEDFQSLFDRYDGRVLVMLTR